MGIKISVSVYTIHFIPQNNLALISLEALIALHCSSHSAVRLRLRLTLTLLLSANRNAEHLLLGERIVAANIIDSEMGGMYTSVDTRGDSGCFVST